MDIITLRPTLLTNGAPVNRPRDPSGGHPSHFRNIRSACVKAHRSRQNLAAISTACRADRRHIR